MVVILTCLLYHIVSCNNFSSPLYSHYFLFQYCFHFFFYLCLQSQHDDTFSMTSELSVMLFEEELEKLN